MSRLAALAAASLLAACGVKAPPRPPEPEPPAAQDPARPEPVEGRATPTSTSTGCSEAAHPEPFDSAASGRYAQDRLRVAADGAESRDP